MCAAGEDETLLITTWQACRFTNASSKRETRFSDIFYVVPARDMTATVLSNAALERKKKRDEIFSKESHQTMRSATIFLRKAFASCVFLRPPEICLYLSRHIDRTEAGEPRLRLHRDSQTAVMVIFLSW